MSDMTGQGSAERELIARYLESWNEFDPAQHRNSSMSCGPRTGVTSIPTTTRRAWTPSAACSLRGVRSSAR